MSETLSSFATALRQGMNPDLDGWSSSRTEAHFAELALRLFRLQHAANPDYRQLCEARGVRAEVIHRWQDIPAVPTSAFKQSAFSCLAPGERTMFFESSGTTATSRSRHHHSPASLALYEASLRPWFRAHLRPVTNSPRWMLSLTPSPVSAPHSSLAHMLDCVARGEPFEQVRFAGTRDGHGDWQVDHTAARDFLERAARDDIPVLLTGTAFNFVHWLEHLEQERTRLRLPEGSRVMETGGYKGRSRSLSKSELHQWLGQMLSVSPNHVVTEYGMTELSSQAYDRVAGASDATLALRFPPWTRALVVSPETGREAASHEVGLLRVYDLANVFSVLAIETEDLGWQDADGLHLLGRHPQLEPRGCSLQSGDLTASAVTQPLATAHAS